MVRSDPPASVWATRAGAVIYGLILMLGGVDLLRAGNGTGPVLGRFSALWVGAIAVYSLAAAVIGLFCLRVLVGSQEGAERVLADLELHSARFGAGRWAVVLLLVAFPSIVFLGSWGSSLTGSSIRTVVLLTCSLVAGLFIPRVDSPRLGRVLLTMLATATIFVFAKHLVAVTDYPFKLGWSEGNRLWDYSLYFGRDRYLVEGPFRYPSSLTPGRHGLWGLPFLIPGVTIAAVRLWDAVLWTVPYLLLSLAVFSALRHSASRAVRFGLALWGFLFLSQGPIYAPLVLSALLLVLGYDRDRPWKTALFAFAACFYAGISRWTWMVAPAIWAGLLALLDSPRAVTLLRRFARPVLLGAAGLAGAALSYGLMAWAFPQPDPIYTTSLSQPLLWYRLLPNPTNPIGVLPALVIAVGPAAGLAAWAQRKRALAWDGRQWLGLAFSLVGFLGAGLVASLKIGGGSNLHNLDMFLVTVVILTGIIAKKALDPDGFALKEANGLARALIVLSVAVVGWGTVRQGGPVSLPSDDAVEGAIEILRDEVTRASAEGEVLFLDQRQLLTFGEISGVPLVMEYELKDVVNQAMAGNQAFFEGLYRDLARGRFSLIVSAPVETELRGRGHPFGEEDDAQVIYLYRPLLEYYEPVVILDDVSVWLLRPRMQSAQLLSESTPEIVGEPVRP